MAIKDAIQEVGSQEKLAEIMGVTRQAVGEWLKKNRPPAERCIAIERATGGKITRYQLRPDVFGDPR